MFSINMLHCAFDKILGKLVTKTTKMAELRHLAPIPACDFYGPQAQVGVYTPKKLLFCFSSD